jgi:hypothetical protein
MAIVSLCLCAFFWKEVWQTWCAQKEEPLERSACLVPYFALLTQYDETPHVLTHAMDLQKRGVIDDCHVIAHTVGAANLKKYDGDSGAALATCSMGCIEGCYHGVMEAYVAEGGEDITQNNYLTICDSVSKDALLFRQCLHGVGHGLLRHSEGALQSAVSACARFPTEYARITCMGGVFMQNIQNATYGDEANVIENLTKACTPIAQDTTLYPICTEAIGTGIMFYTGHDLERTKTLCTRLDPTLHSQCIQQATAELELHNSILAN